jgi:hypothetical protein
MKVYIGKYTTWIGSYQIADLLKKVGVSEDRCYKIGEWLSNTFIHKICEWIDSKKKRKIKVKIHEYDTWNIDNTLAIIILPLLKLYKEQNQGSARVDDEDAPENISSFNAKPRENEYDFDDNNEARWDYVVDELIWTFEQLHPDNDWESLYHTGEIDMKFNPIKYDEKGEPELYEMLKGEKDTHVFDKEGFDKHNKKIQNGLRLFGKYFRALWT